MKWRVFFYLLIWVILFLVTTFGREGRHIPFSQATVQESSNQYSTLGPGMQHNLP